MSGTCNSIMVQQGGGHLLWYEALKYCKSLFWFLRLFRHYEMIFWNIQRRCYDTPFFSTCCHGKSRYRYIDKAFAIPRAFREFSFELRVLKTRFLKRPLFKLYLFTF